MDDDSVTSLCVSRIYRSLTVAHSLGTDLETGTVLSCHHIFLGITAFKNEHFQVFYLLPDSSRHSFYQNQFRVVKWLLNSRTAYCYISWS